MPPTVSTKIDDHVATITFQDHDRRNALTAELLGDLRDAVDAVDGEDDVWTVVLRGEPTSGTYCSGYDIAEFEEGRPPDETERHFDEAVERLAAVEFPVIAAMDGDVWGGGVELVAACDIRVAAEGVRFGITPAKLGIIYAPRGVRRFLKLMNPADVAELLYTANPVTADRARTIGLVNHVVEPDAVGEKAQSLAADITDNAPLSLSGTKQMLRAFEAKRELSDTETDLIRRLRTEAYESHDHAEAKAAFAADRNPEFEGR